MLIYLYQFYFSRQSYKYVYLVVLLLISRSCITHGDDYDYNPTLYEAFKKALVSNETNLIRLQSHFFPSSGNSRTSATIAINSCDFTVKNISANYTGAFEKCSDDLYCFAGNISYRLSKDASSSSKEMLKQHVSALVDLLKLFDYISVTFFDSVTFSKLASPKGNSDIRLSLSIPELHTMPSFEEVYATLPLLLSWVSLVARNRCPVKNSI